MLLLCMYVHNGYVVCYEGDDKKEKQSNQATVYGWSSKSRMDVRSVKKNGPRCKSVDPAGKAGRTDRREYVLHRVSGCGLTSSEPTSAFLDLGSTTCRVSSGGNRHEFRSVCTLACMAPRPPPPQALLSTTTPPRNPDWTAPATRGTP